MGAAWMGFVRSAPPSEDLAQRLVADLRELYGKGRDEVQSHPGVIEAYLGTVDDVSSLRRENHVGAGA